MLKNLKLRAKILLILLLISFITAGIVGTIALTLGTSTLKEESYKKLTAIRELKANQIENYFQLIFDQVVSFSEDRMVIEATLEFKSGFDNVRKELDYSSEELIQVDSVLHSYYETQFLEKLYYRDSTINYFSIPQDELLRNQELWLEIYADEYSGSNTGTGFPKVKPSEFYGNLKMSGSSTVSSLVKHFVNMFKEDGAKGDIVYHSSSTSEGLEELVNGSEIAIVGSSHILNPDEKNLFSRAGLKPISFRIGTDALVVVISEKNAFLSNLSTKKLIEAFTTAEVWSDINPDWPNELIKRFIPTPGSGSYNIFSEVLLNGDNDVLSNIQNTTIIKDGKQMISQMRTDPFTIAFFSYNYFDPGSSLKILEIDGLKLNNTTIRNKSYPFVRPLYLITTESKLEANKEIGILLNYFINVIDDEVGINLNKIDYWPQHENHRILQYHYLANDIEANEENKRLFASMENSTYNETHLLYHPVFKNYLDRFGYYDIFIIDADSGHIIYSTSKEVDFATDIMHGAYRNTNLAEVFKQAINSDDPHSICFEDFSPYPPSFNAPASFIASPIYDGVKKIGVLVFQLPIDKINNIMTDGYQWEKVGLGKTGETYLVGSDYLIRNQSRFLIEDPDNYYHTLEKTNISQDIISKIKILNSAIGLQPVITEGTQDALKGKTETQIFTDYRGVEVLSAYKPLAVDQLNWVIMSEIDKDEAFAAIPKMIETFSYWFIILILIVLVLSFLFARSISRPVQLLTQRASDLAMGNLDDSITIEQSDEIGLLADNFEKMRCSVKKLVVDLKDINQNLEKKVDKRTIELNRAKEAADAILDKSPVPVAVVDISSTKFLRVNDAMTEFNKLESSELLKKTTLEIYFDVEKDRGIVVDQLREFGKVENLEMQLKRIGTGEERWGLVSIHPITYLGKEVYITSIIDITERKESEEKLHTANQQIQGIVDSLADALIIIDDKGQVQAFSPSAENLFMYTASEIIGENINKLMPSPNKEKHDGYLERYNKTREARLIGKEREVEALRKDGTVFPARLVISEVLTGNKRQYVGLIGDISDRKEMESHINQQKKLLENTLESLSHPFYVIDTSNFEILIANSAARKSADAGVSTCHALTHKSSTPCNSETDPCPVNIVRKTKKPTVVEHIHYDKDGNTVYAEVHGYPVFDEHGEVIQMIEYSLDITERKKVEEAIRISENKFRSIAATASDAIISANEKGEIESWNNAAHTIFGYTEEEVKGKDLEIIIPEKHREGHHAGMNRVLSGGEKRAIGHSIELEGKRKDGSIFPIELSLSSWEGKEGMNFSGIIRDITERKVIEKALKKANERMQGELNVAKDIQMSMLPLIFPAFPKRSEIDLYASLIPAREVGGDFYDFYFLDENHICFVVGDVSGKGVPAALMMAVTKTLLKSQAGTDKSTASIITHVNNEIAKDNDTYMFITVFMAILNTNTGELVYSNAGHNPSYILNKDNPGLIKLGDLHGPVVGAMENMTYKESTLFINKNDIVIAYTDGITEAQNINEELYSDERFIEFLIAHRHESPKEIINQIIDSVKTFEDGAEQFDDITVLAVEYIQEPNTVSHDSTSLEIKNDLKEIISVIDHFEDFGTKNNIPFPIVQKFNIAFDELLNNNISYGFQDDKEHLININIEIKGSRLIITIGDDGMPFNPFVNDPPDTKLNVAERGMGGLGIHIVKNLMDEYEYKRTADKNIITLVKHNINK